MTANAKALKALIDQIRRSFQLLSRISEDAIADLGLTVAARAVLEHVAEEGPQTVPQIAAAKTVRRQSIQVLVDRLSDDGLVRLTENPGHRRSQLVAMSKKGERVFAEVRAREARLLRKFAAELDTRDVAVSIETLETLRRLLAPDYKGESDDDD